MSLSFIWNGGIVLQRNQERIFFKAYKLYYTQANNACSLIVRLVCFKSYAHGRIHV